MKDLGQRNIVFNSFLLLILLAAFSCNSKITGEAILNKSIEFHDPENEWNSLKQKLKISSNFVYPDSSFYQLEIGLDNQNQRVMYSNNTLGQQVEFQKDSCTIISGNRNCEQLKWTHGFYHFIPGLPMTLKGNDAKIAPNAVDTTFHGLSCHKIQVDFEKEKWHFYISKENYRLIGYDFNKNFEAKSEEILGENLYEIGNMKLIKSRSWWITTDSLIYSGKDEIIGNSPWL
ncbi:DUF6503 family protein [Arcticibacterium luteifluviistationis]|uniref:Uncharacterized protein n=1 Tax=Arcticibacterium luteifluviistationis TaxID=1784714 RepID=A0A2Z4GCE7_9BACT|nr:DUF6503 family protein [Arcticibacterium luteifluviistationis]AWV98738.1 hypothetical protein DJ013_11365 [Arcticibacterium luteifluviistationis]